MDQYGRLAELRKVAEGMGIDVDMVLAVPPNSPMGTQPSFFIVAEKGVLCYEPRHIGRDFEAAYSHLNNMRSRDLFIQSENSRPYYGG